MATITLTALPARFEQSTEPFLHDQDDRASGHPPGPRRRLGKEPRRRPPARGLLRPGCAARHPAQSFTVLVSVAKGSRKPNGFDAARGDNGLGQESWMKTVVQDDRMMPGFAA